MARCKPRNLLPPRRLEPKRRDAGAGYLRVFGGFHPADAHCADALAIFENRHATLQHAFQPGRAQKRDAPAIDHFFVNSRFAAAQRRRSGLGRRDLRGNRGHAVKPPKRPEVAAVVHNGNNHRPLVLQGFRFSGSNDGSGVGRFEGGFGFHGQMGVN